MSQSLPDVPYAQLQYRSALLSTEFAAERRRTRTRRTVRSRWSPKRRG